MTQTATTVPLPANATGRISVLLELIYNITICFMSVCVFIFIHIATYWLISLLVIHTTAFYVISSEVSWQLDTQRKWCYRCWTMEGQLPSWTQYLQSQVMRTETIVQEVLATWKPTLSEQDWSDTEDSSCESSVEESDVQITSNRMSGEGSYWSELPLWHQKLYK